MRLNTYEGIINKHVMNSHKPAQNAFFYTAIFKLSTP